MIKLFVVFTVFIIVMELEPALSRHTVCSSKPGSNVSDTWCENNCRAGAHPACKSSSGVHQKCICDDSSSDCVDKAMNCKVQLKHKNYCKHEDAEIRKFFLEQCQKSCGSCDDSSTGVCKSCNCWTCLNGGTCSVKNKNPTCKCPSGFSGSHCHFTVAVTSSIPSSTQGYPSTGPSTTIGYPSTKEPCEDTSEKCAKFVPKFCTKNKFVMEKCKASCGLCDSPTTAGETTTGYPPTESITAGSTTAGNTTTGYPSTDSTTAGSTTTGTTTGYPSTPLRRLCSARLMNRCRCGCKNAGPPEPKMECNKKQKKICPCKCNNL